MYISLHLKTAENTTVTRGFLCGLLTPQHLSHLSPSFASNPINIPSPSLPWLVGNDVHVPFVTPLLVDSCAWITRLPPMIPCTRTDTHNISHSTAIHNESNWLKKTTLARKQCGSCAVDVCHCHLSKNPHGLPSGLAPISASQRLFANKDFSSVPDRPCPAVPDGQRQEPIVVPASNTIA